MQNNFIFKKIKISYKKLYYYSKILSNKPILFYLKNFFFNKVDFFIKKIYNVIVNNCKTTNVFVLNFYVGKSYTIKKVNFRAKGRINFFLRRYSNVKIKVIYG